MVAVAMGVTKGNQCFNACCHGDVAIAADSERAQLTIKQLTWLKSRTPSNDYETCEVY